MGKGAGKGGNKSDSEAGSMLRALSASSKLTAATDTFMGRLLAWSKENGAAHDTLSLVKMSRAYEGREEQCWVDLSKFEPTALKPEAGAATAATPVATAKPARPAAARSFRQPSAEKKKAGEARLPLGVEYQSTRAERMDLQSISAMPQYEAWSLAELRMMHHQPRLEYDFQRDAASALRHASAATTTTASADTTPKAAAAAAAAAPKFTVAPAGGATIPGFGTAAKPSVIGAKPAAQFGGAVFGAKLKVSGGNFEAPLSSANASASANAPADWLSTPGTVVEANSGDGGRWHRGEIVDVSGAGGSGSGLGSGSCAVLYHTHKVGGARLETRLPKSHVRYVGGDVRKAAADGTKPPALQKGDKVTLTKDYKKYGDAKSSSAALRTLSDIGIIAGLKTIDGKDGHQPYQVSGPHTSGWWYCAQALQRETASEPRFTFARQTAKPLASADVVQLVDKTKKKSHDNGGNASKLGVESALRPGEVGLVIRTMSCVAMPAATTSTTTATAAAAAVKPSFGAAAVAKPVADGTFKFSLPPAKPALAAAAEDASLVQVRGPRGFSNWYKATELVRSQSKISASSCSGGGTSVSSPLGGKPPEALLQMDVDVDAADAPECDEAEIWTSAPLRSSAQAAAGSGGKPGMSYPAFLWDGMVKESQTRPEYFMISAGGKTATHGSSSGTKNIAATPPQPLTPGSAFGFSVRILKISPSCSSDYDCIGITDTRHSNLSARLGNACIVLKNGQIKVDGNYPIGKDGSSTVVTLRKMKDGDVLHCSMDVGKLEVSFSINDEPAVTVCWTPQGEVRPAFGSGQDGMSLELLPPPPPVPKSKHAGKSGELKEQKEQHWLQWELPLERTLRSVSVFTTSADGLRTPAGFEVLNGFLEDVADEPPVARPPKQDKTGATTEVKAKTKKGGAFMVHGKDDGEPWSAFFARTSALSTAARTATTAAQQQLVFAPCDGGAKSILSDEERQAMREAAVGGSVGGSDRLMVSKASSASGSVWVWAYFPDSHGWAADRVVFKYHSSDADVAGSLYGSNAVNMGDGWWHALDFSGSAFGYSHSVWLDGNKLHEALKIGSCEDYVKALPSHDAPRKTPDLVQGWHTLALPRDNSRSAKASRHVRVVFESLEQVVRVRGVKLIFDDEQPAIQTDSAAEVGSVAEPMRLGLDFYGLHAVAAIQALARGNAEKATYSQLRAAAATIQQRSRDAAWKARLAQVRQRREAATLIANSGRRLLACRLATSMRRRVATAVFLQSLVRANLAPRSLNKQYQGQAKRRKESWEAAVKAEREAREKSLQTHKTVTQTASVLWPTSGAGSSSTNVDGRQELAKLTQILGTLDHAAPDAEGKLPPPRYEGGIVGLDKIKTIVQAVVEDAAGRKVTGDAMQPRHVVITGNMGSGKHMCAQLVARALTIIGAVNGNLHSDYGTWGGGAAEGRNDLLDQMLEHRFGSLKCSVQQLVGDVSGCSVEHFRVGTAVNPEKAKAFSANLDSLSDSGAVMILSGERACVEKFLAQLPCFRKRAPKRIDLPDVGISELAQVTLSLVKAKGYVLKRGETMPPQVKTDEDLMEHIVSQTYTQKQISQANFYLAAELFERAVSNKNRRVASAELSVSRVRVSPRLQLTCEDFGVEMLSRDEMMLRRKEVDDEIDQMIGYAKAKSFFEEIKQKIRYVEDGGDRSVLIACLNCVVTGRPGTGKTTFARLLFRFLRAYGVLQKDVFEEINGLDLKDQYVGGTAPKVQGYFKKAMGGCLFIDEAYSISSSEAGRQTDSFSAEAVRTLLTEVENNRTSVLVVLAGYKDKMRELMRADPGLERRFPRSVELEDYTPAELAQIAVKVAAESYGLTFEEGLQEKLATHIEDHHSAEIPQQNGGLARNIVEKAADNFSERMIKEKQADPSSKAIHAKVLHAEDFGIFEVVPEDQYAEREEIEKEVVAMIGMEAGKRFFEEVKRKMSFVEAGGNRKIMNVCLNMVITGSPGTGKTTLARLIGRYLHAWGVLPKDTFVEKNGLALKGQYVGHTCPQVQDAVKDAMGGCLFLDEAYALADQGNGSDSFSMEAIRTLLTEVENNRTSILVILAGYKDKMARLLRSDPGMPRRFPMRVHLDDYTPNELSLISEKTAIERFGLSFEPELIEKLATHIGEQHSSEIKDLNGGLAVNLCENATGRLAERSMESGEFDITELVASDFAIDELSADEQARADVEAEIANMVGMADAKKIFGEMRKVVLFVERGGNRKVLQSCLNCVLTGNPGTGKTTLARLMAKFLHAYGVLPKDTFIEKNGLELKGRYVGQTAPQVKDAIADAMGGCLFLDEAYALAGGDSFSGEAIRTLLTEVENNRTNVLVILAGYEAPMERLLRADPGLPRRFPKKIHLPDYSPDELARIAEISALSQGLVFERGLPQKLAAHIGSAHAAEISSHNGGLAVNITEAASLCMAARCVEDEVYDELAMQTLVAADFGIQGAKLCELEDEDEEEEDLYALAPSASGGGFGGCGCDDDACVRLCAAGQSPLASLQPRQASPAPSSPQTPQSPLDRSLTVTPVKSPRQQQEEEQHRLASAKKLEAAKAKKNAEAQRARKKAELATKTSRSVDSVRRDSPAPSTLSSSAASGSSSEDGSGSSSDSSESSDSEGGDGDGEGREREAEAPPQYRERPQPAGEAEEDLEPEVDEDKLIAERLQQIGICPARFNWRRGTQYSNSCMKCGQTFANGFRCEGGSHYVCKVCILGPDKKAWE